MDITNIRDNRGFIKTMKGCVAPLKLKGALQQWH